MKIEITEEDILNLRTAKEKLLKTAEPFYDLEILTIKGIIEKFEQGSKTNTNVYVPWNCIHCTKPNNVHPTECVWCGEKR